MIIDILSDTHGYFPKDLRGGDLLIHCGDWTARDTEEQCFEFFDWLKNQNYTHKVIIAGNHDNRAYVECYKGPFCGSFTYLCDSGTEICHYHPLEKDCQDGTVIERQKIKIWGSPWTDKFWGQNPTAMAFVLDTEAQMMERFDLIPEGTDILITHSPPFGILDKTHKKRTGSKSLLDRIEKIRPRVVCYGHIHENGGKYIEKEGILYINASYMNEHYEPVNKPVRIVL